jgi:chromate reductase
MHLLVIAGSLRQHSFNAALARAAADLAPEDVEVEVYEALASLPLYDQDLDELDGHPPATVHDLRERIEGADAILVVTPEYNGSIPGVLKNAIDWVSARHRGSSLLNKTVAVAGATTGQYGAIWAQQDLRRVLGISGARVIEGEVPVSRAQDVFDKEGRLRDPLVAERLRRHLETLVREASAVPAAA